MAWKILIHPLERPGDMLISQKTKRNWNTHVFTLQSLCSHRRRRSSRSLYPNRDYLNASLLNWLLLMSATAYLFKRPLWEKKWVLADENYILACAKKCIWKRIVCEEKVAVKRKRHAAWISRWQNSYSIWKRKERSGKMNEKAITICRMKWCSWKVWKNSTLMVNESNGCEYR